MLSFNSDHQWVLELLPCIWQLQQSHTEMRLTNIDQWELLHIFHEGESSTHVLVSVHRSAWFQMVPVHTVMQDNMKAYVKPTIANIPLVTHSM